MTNKVYVIGVIVATVIMALVVDYAVVSSLMDNDKRECSASNFLEHFPSGEVHRDSNRTSVIWKNKCNQAKMRLIIFDRGNECK